MLTVIHEDKRGSDKIEAAPRIFEEGFTQQGQQRTSFSSQEVGRWMSAVLLVLEHSVTFVKGVP